MPASASALERAVFENPALRLIGVSRTSTRVLTRWVLSNAMRSAISLPSYPTVYTVKGSAFMRGEVRALRGLPCITLLPGRLLELVTESLAREAVTARDEFFAVRDLWLIACPAYLAGALPQSRSYARHRRPADPCHGGPASPSARALNHVGGRRRNRSVPSWLVRRLHGRPSVVGRGVGRGTYGMVGHESPGANSVSGGVDMQIRAAKRYAHYASRLEGRHRAGRHLAGPWRWRRWARPNTFSW